MGIAGRMYDQMPESVRPVARKWYYVFHPGLSWRKFRKADETTDEFVERFFDDWTEYEGYMDEFSGGRIRDICGQALEEVDGDRSIFDSHFEICGKYYSLLRKRRPETVVQTGVFSGVSTTAALLALDRNETGTLHTLDPGIGTAVDGGIDPADPDVRFYERGRPSCSDAESHELPDGKRFGWIIPDDLRERWRSRVGRSREELPSLLADAGEVDVFFQNSEHSTAGMLLEFELAWERLSPGGVLVSSHVDRNDAFETFTAERECTHGLTAFQYVGTSAEYDQPCSCGYVVKE